VTEGEDWQAAARDLIVEARGLVYENLGITLPARATEPDTAKPVTDDKAAKKAAAAAKKTAAAAKKAETKKAEAPADGVTSSESPISADAVPEAAVPDVVEKVAEEAAVPEEADDTPVASAEDVQRFIADMMTQKKIDSARVKEALAGFKANRITELPEQKRQEFMDHLSSLASK
jgi:hypothetical protein